MAGGSRLKRAIGGIYSFAAERFYEPVVVKGAFRVFGGPLNELVLEQGRQAVASARGGPILDMPVGTAYFTIEAARLHDGVMVGADIAEGMVREAGRAARAAGLTNLSSVRADAHNLPFSDGAFAAILCTNGLQVIPGTKRALEELTRVLAPGATLYVSVVALPLSALLPQRAADRLPGLFLRGSDYARLLAAAGLRVAFVRRSRMAWTIAAAKPEARL